MTCSWHDHEADRAAAARAADRPLSDNPGLHEIYDLVARVQRHALGDVPLPPTMFDLALAVNTLALAVAVLAARALAPEEA